MGMGATVVVVVGGTTTMFCSKGACLPCFPWFEGVAGRGDGGVAGLVGLAGDLGGALVLLFFEFITLERVQFKL